MNGAIIPVDITDSDTVNAIKFIKRGNTVSFYGSISGMSTNTSLTYGTVKQELRPSQDVTYAVSPLYSKTAPYLVIGSVWIDFYGEIAIYKGSQTEAYVAGTYVVP